MAWLYKRGGIWWIGWRHEGKQYLESTELSERAEADKTLRRFEELRRQKRNGTLTAEFFELLTGKSLKRIEVAAYLKSWLEESKGVTSPQTLSKYEQVVREFESHIKAEQTGLLLSDVTPDHVKSFLISKRERAALSTVAGFRRILRSIFIQAQEEGKITGNPVQSANRAKNRVKDRTNEIIRKRPFTLDEIRTLLSFANQFWKYMIEAGFFTGMRMGDAVTLQRAHVNVNQNQLNFVSRKTGKPTKIPMHPKLRESLLKFPNGQAEEYYWPQEAQRYLTSGASAFSQEFYDLMTKAGIVKARDPKKLGSGKGRAAKREQAPVGFHNLRHTFVSMLKLSGANDSIAKELAGHRSDSISAVYTHLPHDALAAAINKLPHVAD
jgi:integrase